MDGPYDEINKQRDSFWELTASLVETLIGERPYVGQPLDEVCLKVARAIDRAKELKTIAMN